MTLDNEQQRAFLIDLFNAVQIPGQHLALAYAVKVAIESASVPVPSKAPAEAQDA